MKICKVENCNNKQRTKGYCQKHYVRFKKYGNPFYTETGRDQEKHGMIFTPEYKAWQQMKDRCFNKNHKSYHRYGGRGITVCDRWLNSFLAFYADMGKKPFPKAQIDRIDNDGNYESSNCRWVSQAENCRNSSWVKLTMQKANEIRKLYKTGNITQTTLAGIYGLTAGGISETVNNKRWRQKSNA